MQSYAVISGFNPRPRMGGDEAMYSLQLDYWVSIHAPAWGATDMQQ